MARQPGDPGECRGGIPVPKGRFCRENEMRLLAALAAFVAAVKGQQGPPPQPFPVPPAGGVPAQQPLRQLDGTSLLQSQVAQTVTMARDLVSADAELRSEVLRDTEQAHAILKELKQAQFELVRQRRATRTLEQEVLHERSEAASCQHEVQQLESPHSEQVRRAALLRLRSASANTHALEARISQTEQEVAAFKRSGDTQLTAVKTALQKMKQQVADAESELHTEIGGRARMEKEVRVAEGEVRALKAKLAANGMSILLANSTQLKADLQQAQKALEMSEANEARAGLASARARDAAAVLRRSAQADAEQAQKIARQSLAEIMSVRKEDTARTIQMESAVREAQGVTLDSCDSIWDEMHPEITAKLQQCEQTKLDLQTATAELASMSSILKATGARAATTAE